MDYLNDMFSLKGNVALVTGGSYGIGFAIAKALARAGAARNANGHNVVHVLSLRAENAAFDILYHILRNIKRTAL